MIFINLFLSFLQIGLFSIGGGYAALPLIQNQIVDIHGWLSLKEFIDVISIAEMTPGPIAINSATFVGIKVAGIGGAVVATLGCILPSCVIVLTLAFLYHKFKELTVVQGILSGLRPAVVALIASAGLTILLLTLFHSEEISSENIDFSSVLIIIVSLVILRVNKLNPICIIGGSGAYIYSSLCRSRCGS
jgi:chromate transporter